MAQALYTHWHEIIVGDSLAFEIAVSYTAIPGTADSWDEPGDLPEFEIRSATFQSDYGPADFPLTAEDHIAIYFEIAERHQFARDGRDPDDWRDYRIDMALLDQIHNEDALIDF